MTGFGAILLAGGRARRMGGVAKPLLEVDGRTLLRRAVDAVDGAVPVTAVAAVLDEALEVDWVREEPPFSGPAAAIVAALAAWERRGAEPAWALVLACDLARPDRAVDALRAAEVDDDLDGLCLLDEAGAHQWLAGLYRTSSLRRAAAELADDGRGAPVRALLAGLAIRGVPADATAVADVDTWEDLDEARTRAARQEDS